MTNIQKYKYYRTRKPKLKGRKIARKGQKDSQNERDERPEKA